MKKVLLLDLEETIIPEFGNFYVPDHWGRCVRNFIKEQRFSEVRIFSWAIYNQKDKLTFEKFALPIGLEVGSPFEYIYTIEEIIDLIRKHCNIKLNDINDFFDFYTKERALFDLIINGWSPNTHFVLLDDAVKELELRTESTVFESVNFKKLLKKGCY